VGLKENVILGHLIPAGTGFHTYQDGEVRIRPQALEGLVPEKEDVLARHFPLLDGGAPEGADKEETSQLDAGPVPLPDDFDEEEQPTKSAVSPLDSFFIDDDLAEE
jgi:DNA-directed RNA polymerase subunit beta'